MAGGGGVAWRLGQRIESGQGLRHASEFVVRIARAEHRFEFRGKEFRDARGEEVREAGGDGEGLGVVAVGGGAEEAAEDLVDGVILDAAVLGGGFELAEAGYGEGRQIAAAETLLALGQDFHHGIDFDAEGVVAGGGVHSCGGAEAVSGEVAGEEAVVPAAVGFRDAGGLGDASVAAEGDEEAVGVEAADEAGSRKLLDFAERAFEETDAGGGEGLRGSGRGGEG